MRSPSRSSAVSSTTRPWIPIFWRARSISGWRSRRPETRTASAAVAPAASVRLTASSRQGSAYTTSTLRLGTQLVGAPRKGVDHGIGDVVEERLQEPREGSGHLLPQRELARGGLG